MDLNFLDQSSRHPRKFKVIFILFFKIQNQHKNFPLRTTLSGRNVFTRERERKKQGQAELCQTQLGQLNQQYSTILTFILTSYSSLLASHLLIRQLSPARTHLHLCSIPPSSFSNPSQQPAILVNSLASSVSHQFMLAYYLLYLGWLVSEMKIKLTQSSWS